MPGEIESLEEIPEIEKEVAKGESPKPQSESSGKPQLPIGEGGKLNEFAAKHWKEQLVLFSGVRNTTKFVNQEVHAPLKLEEGKPSPLGLFAEATFVKPPEEVSPGSHPLEVVRGHGRTALLGRVIFGDSSGRLYRDIDVKGVGDIFHFRDHTVEKVLPGVGELGALFESGRRGLLDLETALYDLHASEYFIRAGIRTYRVLGVIELEELIQGRQKIDLEQARSRGIIEKGFRPVIEVRAYGTRARVQDLWHSSTEYKDTLLDDAKELVTQELGRGDKLLTDQEYLDWFAETLGRNVALIHKNGLQHTYLTDHNVTLDCRIIDLDSVVDLSSREAERAEQKNTDLSSARATVSDLAWVVGERMSMTNTEPLKQEMEEKFNAAYELVMKEGESSTQ